MSGYFGSATGLNPIQGLTGYFGGPNPQALYAALLGRNQPQSQSLMGLQAATPQSNNTY